MKTQANQKLSGLEFWKEKTEKGRLKGLQSVYRSQERHKNTIKYKTILKKVNHENLEEKEYNEQNLQYLSHVKSSLPVIFPPPDLGKGFFHLRALSGTRSSPSRAFEFSKNTLLVTRSY